MPQRGKRLRILSSVILNSQNFWRGSPAPQIGLRRGKPFGLTVTLLAGLLLGCAPPNGDGVALFKAGKFKEAHGSLVTEAENNHPDAQNCLAILLYLGLGIPRDLSRAAQWFERAANLGDSSAQLNLGLLYLNGTGVKRDNARAFGWFQAASDRGNSRAQHYLAILTDNLTPNQMHKATETIRRQISESSMP